MEREFLLEQKALQQLFDAGALKSVSVQRFISPTDGKPIYWLEFRAKNEEAGSFGTYWLRAQRKKKYEDRITARYFNSLDAAVATAERIGFKKVEVVLARESDLDLDLDLDIDSLKP